MGEIVLKAKILLKTGLSPILSLFNCPNGFGYSGEVQGKPQAGKPLVLLKWRPVTFGLVPGSGDLIGWKEKLITPDMVGQTIAQFVSAEVKLPNGVQSAKQKAWHKRVLKAGGIAVVLRSEEDAKELMK